MERPVIGLVLGDATGIGPELCAKLLASGEAREAARVVVVGDARVLELGARDAGVEVPWRAVAAISEADWDGAAVPVLDLGNQDPAALARGTISGEAGKATGEALARAVELALRGEVDGVTYGPLNKAALNAGGWHYPDDLQLVQSVMARTLGGTWHGGPEGSAPPHGELNVLEELWTSRVTSHVPLKDVAAHLTEDAVLEAIRLIDGALRASGMETPRIAVAALNPHAGDNGLCGDEETRVIRPGVERALAEGITCDGPFASDTVFLRARAGAFDAVVSMYHDQGQIATKLMGFSRGVTVLAGLPAVLTTPAHGTAHDIVGQGKADPGALRNAFRLAARMATSRARAKQAVPA
jgi:4-hydroxythreonine-4-phosphate dehydrogenase